MKTLHIIYKMDMGTETDAYRSKMGTFGTVTNAYSTKKEAKEEYKANGLQVVAVLTEKDVKELQEATVFQLKGKKRDLKEMVQELF